MTEVAALHSEDDIRTKVVSTWLSGHGISPNNISIEYSFAIRLGRSIIHVEDGELKKTASPTICKRDLKSSAFRPRADVLVRSIDGKNLIIVEVKAPDEPLDDDARDQGISYARLLHKGNIAPFVVLTNGRETRIFDSITKEQIDGVKIPLHHPYAKAGFCISGDDLLLQSEALEILISLSPKNLIAFCEAQSTFRMSRLRSDDLNSGKKYIPSLYVEREAAKKDLLELLENQKRRVVILVGLPQVGKTNFVCHMVEERIAQGNPSLFYPAIGVQRSLLHEISEDFGWVLGDINSSHQFIHHKLRSVLRRAGKRLVVFIDGWNETDIKLAQIIDQESERLSCDEIQIVISMTNIAAGRLLKGNAGNPSFIADAALISDQAIQLIETSPDASKKTNWSVVLVNRYSPEEVEEAYSKYAQVYDVQVPATHKRVDEPYLLGIAMRLFQHSSLPINLDEPDLLEKFIQDKINRAIGLERYDTRMLLYKLAEEIFNNGAPVSKEVASKLWNIPVVEKIPTGLFEAALLAEVTSEKCLPSIDFYYGRDRDFIIAYWAQNWLNKLQKQADLVFEFNQASSSNAGLEALRWFFKQSKHIEYIKSRNGNLPTYDNPLIRRTLLTALCDLVARSHDTDSKWLEYAINHATSDPDNLVRIEAAKLTALIAKSEDDLVTVLPNDILLEDFILEILSINEEYPLEVRSVGQVVLDALRELHWQSSMEEFKGSEITSILTKLMNHRSRIIREGAASCLGYIEPWIFFQVLAIKVKAGILNSNSKSIKEYATGVLHASKVLSHYYYGDMCPGQLEFLCEDPEELSYEYKKMCPVLEPVINLYSSKEIVQSLMNILEDLRPKAENEESEEQQYDSPYDSPSKPSLDIYTIPLPFDKPDKN